MMYNNTMTESNDKTVLALIGLATFSIVFYGAIIVGLFFGIRHLFHI